MKEDVILKMLAIKRQNEIRERAEVTIFEDKARKKTQNVIDNIWDNILNQYNGGNQTIEQMIEIFDIEDLKNLVYNDGYKSEYLNAANYNRLYPGKIVYIKMKNLMFDLIPIFIDELIGAFKEGNIDAKVKDKKLIIKITRDELDEKLNNYLKLRK